MSDAFLAWFDCMRCGSPFMSYVRAKIHGEVEDSDFSVISDEYGDLSNNSYVYALKDKRECRLCRKGVALEVFF